MDAEHGPCIDDLPTENGDVPHFFVYSGVIIHIYILYIYMYAYIYTHICIHVQSLSQYKQAQSRWDDTQVSAIDLERDHRRSDSVGKLRWWLHMLG